jgi:hypothetical protein
MQIRSLRDLKEVLIISILTIFVLFVGERLGLWEPGGDLDNFIYEAAESGDIEAVKQHLADETDIELKCTGCGGTALGHAAKHGHNEIAELLIENGADVNAKNDDDITPLDWAVDEDYPETAELLRKHGGKTSEELKAEGNPVQ